MAALYVPNLMSFQNDNIFLGSHQGVRFRLAPQVAEATILAEYWHGALCYECSEIAGQETFPLTQAGIDAMAAWIEGLAAKPL